MDARLVCSGGKVQEGLMSICGKPMPKARNGADRGICTRPHNHGPKGGCHGNGTCFGCGIKLTSLTSSFSVANRGQGECKVCKKERCRKDRGSQPLNVQNPGEFHAFPCGCSGVLPVEGSNKFSMAGTHRGKRQYVCRVSFIIKGSNDRAKKGRYQPIFQDTPHTVIRKLMEEPNCECCGETLSWKVLARGKTPHLHHDHKTGEIYGFAHPKCNPLAMEKEIERLKALLKAQEMDL